MTADTETSDHDMPKARGTYERFIGMAKWGTIVAALLAALAVFLIAG